LPAYEALGAFLHGMIAHMQAHQGLARTLATLLSSDHGSASGQLAEGTRVLEQAVTDLVKAAVQEGAVRVDTDAATVAGAAMIALHGIGAAHDRPRWQAEADSLITAMLDGIRWPP
jgi:hypothetical protein